MYIEAVYNTVPETMNRYKTFSFFFDENRVESCF